MNLSDGKFIYRLLLFLSLFLGWTTDSVGQQNSFPEYAMKAAFVYNFTLFTQWPEYSENTLTVCTMYSDRLREELEQFASKLTQDNKKIVIQKITRNQNAAQCQVVFLSEEDMTHAPTILALIQNSPVLTVTDIPGWAEKGVIIGMNIQNQRIVFEINLKSAQQAGLQLSSKLLNLARKIYK
ncbi:MAG: YfiR family protein [Burkholderiales bacterium]|nr:YfiR family protein [Nitrosomonas sp.]MCP5276100.1 YfiR family protein [Burkholderiales bacterium]